jgi:GTP cyclohydrolase I
MGALTVDGGYFLLLGKAVEQVLSNPKIAESLGQEHVLRTPERVVKAFQEYFKGCFEDPAEVLRTGFEEQNYDQMVQISRIGFFSTCAHHWAPFFGKVHFAYIPDGKVVGLSKVPRMIEIFARRPQIQEKLTQEIVNCFQDNIKPKGCGAVVEGYHLCMSARGVECEQAFTTTTALTGCFTEASTKMEFLSRVPKGEIWP